MNYALKPDIAALLLRLSLGIVLLAHSAYLKLIIYGLDGTLGFFTSLGLPAFLTYLVIITEILAGIALIIGYKVQLSSLVIIPIFLGASWVHWSNGWLFSNNNGGWEYPVFLIAMALVQLTLGSGKYALEINPVEKI